MATKRKTEFSGATDDGSDSIDNRRPPKNTQFKPGVSGNPSGRRKKSMQAKTVGQAFRDYMKGTVTAREEDGKLKHIPRMDAVMQRFFAAAMKGHPGVARQLLQLVLAEEDIEEAPPPAQELSPEDVETLRSYLKRKDEEGEVK